VPSHRWMREVVSDLMMDKAFAGDALGHRRSPSSPTTRVQTEQTDS
jgi:hypothetical protein